MDDYGRSTGSRISRGGRRPPYSSGRERLARFARASGAVGAMAALIAMPRALSQHGFASGLYECVLWFIGVFFGLFVLLLAAQGYHHLRYRERG
jgi:hypothetical protein